MEVDFNHALTIKVLVHLRYTPLHRIFCTIIVKTSISANSNGTCVMKPHAQSTIYFTIEQYTECDAE